MIYGVGTDVVEVSRIANALERFGDDFAKKILSPEEFLAFQKNNLKENFLAKRFAAKEAFVKSLGTGFRNGVNFNDISVINNKSGKPQLHLSNKLKLFMINKFKIKKFKINLSLADEAKHSIAFVIINKI